MLPTLRTTFIEVESKPLSQAMANPKFLTYWDSFLDY